MTYVDQDGWFAAASATDIFRSEQGDEITLNGRAFNPQVTPSVTVLADGRFVVVWRSFDQYSEGDESDIVGNIFNPDGSTESFDFVVSASGDTGNEGWPEVAALSSGGFVVVWGHPNADGDERGILARLYDENGVAVGEEFLVNSETEGSQISASVSGLVDGGFVVTWVSSDPDTDGDGHGIAAQVFDANGGAVGDEISVNSSQSGNQQLPRVEGLTDGSFVIVWQSETTLNDEGTFGISARVFAANGEPATSEFRVNGFVFADQLLPDVAALEGGGFVVVWTTYSGGRDGDGTAIVATTFDGGWNHASSEFVVNQETQGNQDAASVTGLPGGGFAVSWQSEDSDVDGDGIGISTRFFDAAANAVTDEFTVNTNVVGEQAQSSVATAADGRVIVVWHSDDPNVDGSSSGIAGRIVGEDIIPWAFDGQVQVTVGTSYIFELADFRFIDAEGDALNSVEINTLPEQGVLELDGVAVIAGAEISAADIAAGLLTFTPVAGELAPDYAAFDFTVSDAQDTATSASTMRIGVNELGTPVASSQVLAPSNDGDHHSPAIAVLANGNYVLITTGPGEDGDGVYGQLFDANHNPVGDVFSVSSEFEFSQRDPQVAALESGGFVVTWTSDDPDVSDGHDDVVARIFDSAGNAAGPEFAVNTQNENSQTDPAIAALSNGGFVVTWSSRDPDVPHNGAIQVFGANGDPVGDEIHLDTFNPQRSLKIVALEDGEFIVTWEEFGELSGAFSSSFDDGIRGQRFDADGNTIGEKFWLYSRIDGDQQGYDVASLEGGGFVAIWGVDDGNSVSDFHLVGQLFNADNERVGDTFTFQPDELRGQTYPEVQGLAGGGFVVVWGSIPFDSETLAQVFDSDANLIGSEFTVAAERHSFFTGLGIGALPDGSFIVAWDDVATGRASIGIELQTYEPVILGVQEPIVSDMPESVSVLDDTLSDLILTGIEISDLNHDTLTLTLTVSAGTLEIASGAVSIDGIVVAGHQSETMTLTGSAEDITSFLNEAGNIRYAANSGLTGDSAVQLTVVANDGSGSGDITLGTISIDIDAVSDGDSGFRLSTDYSTSFAVTATGEFVFNNETGLLYVTNGGAIEVFDISTGELLEAIELGGDLSGVDLSLDGTILYVADAAIYTVNGNNSVNVYEINLSTNTVTTNSYFVESERRDEGALDVAFTNTGNVLITDLEASQFGESDLHRIDADTGLVSSLSNVDLGSDSYLVASDSGRFVLILNSYFPNYWLYDALEQKIVAGGDAEDLIDDLWHLTDTSGGGDISEGAELIVVASEGGYLVFDFEFNLLAALNASGDHLNANHFAAGDTHDAVAFSADGSLLYVLNSYVFFGSPSMATGAYVTVYDTQTWEIYNEFPLVDPVTGNAIRSHSAADIYFDLSDDGRFLTVGGSLNIFGAPLTVVLDLNYYGPRDIPGTDGNDLLIARIGADFFDGGGGSDTVDYSAASASVTVWLDGNGTNSGIALNDTYTSIERFIATNYADAFYGSSSADIISGLGAADSLFGNTGNDKLFGGDGDDLLEGGIGNDVLRGDAGSDISYGGDGNDKLWAGASDDAADTLIGGAGDDILAGGGGGDLLVGGGMDEGDILQLLSASGNSADDGADTLFGGDGRDTLIGGGWNDGSVNDNGVYDTGEAITSGTGNDVLWAGDGDDLVIAANGDDILGGGVGDDTLMGGGGNDVIYGGKDAGDTGSNDVIDGGAGDDIIFAGAGDDSINGGSGADNIFSGGGADTVNGGAGDDTLWGGGGDDRFDGGDGADTFIFANTGNDIIADFNLIEDELRLVNTVTDFETMADVEAAASEQNGGLMINLGGGNSLFLEGLSLSDIASMNLVL